MDGAAQTCKTPDSVFAAPLAATTPVENMFNPTIEELREQGVMIDDSDPSVLRNTFSTPCPQTPSSQSFVEGTTTGEHCAETWNEESIADLRLDCFSTPQTSQVNNYRPETEVMTRTRRNTTTELELNQPREDSGGARRRRHTTYNEEELSEITISSQHISDLNQASSWLTLKEANIATDIMNNNFVTATRKPTGKSNQRR